MECIGIFIVTYLLRTFFRNEPAEPVVVVCFCVCVTYSREQQLKDNNNWNLADT